MMISWFLTNALYSPILKQTFPLDITVRKLHNRGSDKQMLCACSGARAALNIAAEKK